MDGAILWYAATDGRCRKRANTFFWRVKVGVPAIVVFLNSATLVEDAELLELVELEVRELLKSYQFPGDTIAIVRGLCVAGAERRRQWERRLMS